MGEDGGGLDGIVDSLGGSQITTGSFLSLSNPSRFQVCHDPLVSILLVTMLTLPAPEGTPQ